MRTTLGHRHAQVMGLTLDEESGTFYLRDDLHQITLLRNNIQVHHRVIMRHRHSGTVLHDVTYTDLETAVLVTHGLARRHGIGEA